MAEMLSPGVFVEEIDASTIVPTVSSSIAVFAGAFSKGPVKDYTLITSVDELITTYGLPNNDNYNDWYQAYNFLQYGNKLYVARAANTEGRTRVITLTAIQSDTAYGETVVPVTSTSKLNVGDFICFGNANGPDIYNKYTITSVIEDTSITLDRPLNSNLTVSTSDYIYRVDFIMNAQFEAVGTNAEGAAVANDYEYVKSLDLMENEDHFEQTVDSTWFSNSTDSKLKIIAKTPGSWGNDLEIAIANASAFNTATPSLAFEGIGLDSLFEYAPTGTEVGIVIRYKGEIVEIFTGDFDKTAKDQNNKSAYIEDVINGNSEYIYVKENTANTNGIANHCYEVDGNSGTICKLVYGIDSEPWGADLMTAYELFNNKDYLDIDIVIGNENDEVEAVKTLVETRKDCIAFIGASRLDTVGQKSSEVISNLISWRKDGYLNFNSMFIAACGNYKYQYDRYNDKNRWINIAGDIAGLRAQTSTNRASWWASAGLERGQIKNAKKLAFNPTQAQIDILYKNGINAIVSFPGQGTVMWGQKTLLDKPSSFDRVNTRGLFNTLERSLSKMAKYQVMEFNDNFTRNRIISMIKPFLSSVQAGRGIQDFLVVCDESNNTPDVISRNQLVVDIYIKPTYVAEFIKLRFTNAGTNSFSEVIGG